MILTALTVILLVADVVFVAYLGYVEGRKRGHAEGAAFVLSELADAIQAYNAQLGERVLAARNREQAEKLAEAAQRGRGSEWN